MRIAFLACGLALALSLLSPLAGLASDRSGFDAAVPSSRQAGGYNNFCQTWAVDVPRVRALFGACVD